VSLGVRGRDATNQSSPSLQLCREAIMPSSANFPARADAVIVLAKSAYALCGYNGSLKASATSLCSDVTSCLKTR
jgi:hypothetical protein